MAVGGSQKGTGSLFKPLNVLKSSELRECNRNSTKRINKSRSSIVLVECCGGVFAKRLGSPDSHQAERVSYHWGRVYWDRHRIMVAVLVLASRSSRHGTHRYSSSSSSSSRRRRHSRGIDLLVTAVFCDGSGNGMGLSVARATPLSRQIGHS